MNIDMKEIKKIIEKYLEGETTLDEEKQLREYLENGNIPKEYEPLRAQFEYFNEAAKEESKTDIDQLAFEESDNKVHKFTEMQRFMIKISGAAATLIIMIAAYFTLFVESDKYANDTIKDPEMAYVEVRSALTLVSSKMNKGTKEINKLKVISESFEKINKLSEFNKKLNKISKLKKFTEYNNKYVSRIVGV